MKLDSDELRRVGKMDDANDVDVEGCDGERAAATPGEGSNGDVGISENKDEDYDDNHDDHDDDDDLDDDDGNGVPIDRGWAWLILFGACLIHMVGNAELHVVPVLMLDIKSALDTTLSTITIVLSLGLFSYTVTTQLAVHVLMNKVSTRTLTTIALGVNCILTLVFAAFPMTEVFMVVHPLKLAMHGLFNIPVLTLVGFYFRRHRAVALTVTILGITAGSIVIPPLTRFLKLDYGFQGCFILISGVEMHGVCAAMLLRPLNNYVRKRRPTVSGAEEKGILPDKDKTKSGPEYELVSTVDTEHTKSTGAEGVTIISESVLGVNYNQPTRLAHKQHIDLRHCVCSCISRMFYWSLLRKPLCLLCVLNYTLAHGGFFTRTYLTAYATTVGVAETKAALLLTIAGAAEIVSMIGFARVADFHILRPHQIIGAASLCIGVVTQFIPSFTQFAPLLFTAVMHGLLSGTGISLNPTLIVDQLGLECLPKMLGLCSLVVSLALAAQFSVVGALVDITGGTSVVFHYAGTCYLLAFILHFLLPLIRWLRTCTCRQREIQ